MVASRPLTAQAETIQRARETAREHPRGPEDLPLAERCVMGFNSGPPVVPGPYNNLIQNLSKFRIRGHRERDGA